MEQSEDIRQIMLRYYEAAQNGYGDVGSAFVSAHPDVVVFGSDPTEIWDGAGYNAAMRSQAQAMGGAIPVYPGNPRAFREGTVGWVIDQPTFRLDEETHLQTRATVILHQEAGDWKIVHLHLSVGVTNADAFGQEL